MAEGIEQIIPNLQSEIRNLKSEFVVLFFQLQDIRPGRYFKAKEAFIQFYIELMVGKLDSIFIAIGIVSDYPDDGKRIFGNG